MAYMVFGLILPLLPLLVAVAALIRTIGLKDRLLRMEGQLERISSDLDWMRVERKSDPGREDTPKPATTPASTRDLPQSTAADATKTDPMQSGAIQRDASRPGPPTTEQPASEAMPRIESPRAPPPAPPKTESFEERLGTQWAVWAGGVALALGGLFLVRYSIEAGLLGPGVRVILGALLAAGLVATAEWMRRGDVQIPIDTLPHAHIPSVLTAAGTIVAFGTIYAAHALYDFIGPALAFILLGAVGIVTMLAAAIHGPALAGIGLAGSLLTPMLVTSHSPNFWSLTVYLAVVAAAAYGLARARTWLWLAMSAVAGASFWGLLMIGRVSGTLFSTGDTSLTDPAAVHALLQLALAAGFMAYQPHQGTRDEAAEPDWIASAALATMTVLVCCFLTAVSFDYWGWMPVALLAIATLVATGWLVAPAAVALCLGGLVALVAVLVWPGLSLPPDKTLLMPYAAAVLRLPENISSFITFAMMTTLVPAAAAALRLWRGPLLPERTSGLYALAATVPALLALILAYLRVTQFDTSLHFALAGVALAAAFAICADRFNKADDAYSVPTYNLAAGAFAAASIAALAFALVVSLDRGYLTVALALAALGTAYVASLRDIRLLRYAVVALGGMVLARIAWDPRIMGSGVGSLPVLNWLLIGYGVPAAAFALAARLLERRASDDLPVRLSDALAVLFTGLLAFFQIRHLTNGGDVFHIGSGHVEAGLMTLVSVGLSYVMAKLHLGKANPVFDIAATLFGAISIAFAAFGLLFAANPYFTGDAISGSPIISSLLTAYLLPGVAALFVARHARNLRPEWFTRAAGILAVSLIFLYVTLEIRHIFKGPQIEQWLGTSDAESWAHSAAWLLLGILFLAYGLLRGSLEARIASGALIVLAALKVTLFDLAGIGGFWRAASFLCLGAVLIGIGLVYQKFVFAKPLGEPGGKT